jgi:hypothetical protein
MQAFGGGRSRYPSGLRHELFSLARTRIPLRVWMFTVCVVCVFLCLCTGRGIATNWSPVQGVLPTVLDLVTEVKQKVSWRRPVLELVCRAKRKKFMMVNWPWYLAVLRSEFRANSFYLHFKYQLLWSLLYHFNVPYSLVNIHGCVCMCLVWNLMVSWVDGSKATLNH